VVDSTLLFNTGYIKAVSPLTSVPGFTSTSAITLQATDCFLTTQARVRDNWTRCSILYRLLWIKIAFTLNTCAPGTHHTGGEQMSIYFLTMIVFSGFVIYWYYQLLILCIMTRTEDECSGCKYQQLWAVCNQYDVVVQYNHTCLCVLDCCEYRSMLVTRKPWLLETVRLCLRATFVIDVHVFKLS